MREFQENAQTAGSSLVLRTACHPTLSCGGMKAADAQSQTGQRVILVDEHDREIGSEEKLAAHQGGGRLHRAFSIFLFHPDGRMLLQQRSRGKYHFPLLWTNACCGHPAPGQITLDAARARLREEIGVEAELVELFTFTYEATDLASGLTEKELDHVFAGKIAGRPQLIEEEAEALQWMRPGEIRAAVDGGPERFTPWFRLVLERVLEEVPKRLDERVNNVRKG